MAIKAQIILAGVLAVVFLVSSSQGYRDPSGRARIVRSPMPGNAGPSTAAETEASHLDATGKKEPAWTPVREPKEFNVNVADGIEGANQIRHEKWDNGAVKGSYAQPMGGKKWQVITYVADKDGYRVTETKTVDEADLPGIHTSAANKGNKAQVDIDQNGAKTSYSVTPDQIASKNNIKHDEHEQGKNAKTN